MLKQSHEDDDVDKELKDDLVQNILLLIFPTVLHTYRHHPHPQQKQSHVT